MEAILAKALGQDATQLAIEEKQRLLSRLLARLAHEIRNPLSSLDIHVQLLDEDLTALAPEIRFKIAGRLDIIQGELKRLENVVKHFLRLSSPSDLSLEPVQMASLVKNVCDLLGPEAQSRHITIHQKVPASLPQVMGDPNQLTQVLMNLIINAMQAVERDGRIELRGLVESENVLLSIRDSGPGLQVKNIGDIFEPYFTTKPEGNGLGLWIAQQIAIAHQGEILAANASDGGALFTLRLPLQRSGTGKTKPLESDSSTGLQAPAK